MVSLICLYKSVLDTDLKIDILSKNIKQKKFNSNLGLSINKKIFKIVFKIKKYYIICI